MKIISLHIVSPSTSLQVYIGEIAPQQYRFAFVTLAYIAYALGTIEAYTLGTFLPYWICAFIHGGEMIILTLFLLPLVKFHLSIQNCIAKAKNALSSFKILRKKSPMKMGSFCKRLLVVELVFIFHVFMGYMVLVQYVGPVLQVAGADRWTVPHGILVALTIGVSDLIGSVLATFVSMRIGHVTSCAIGAAGVCLGHIGNAVYFSLVDSFSASPRDFKDVFNSSINLTVTVRLSIEKCFFEPKINSQLGQDYSPIALISMSIVMLSYGIFWMIQPYVITIELFPDNWRGLALGICTGSYQLNSIILSLVFPFLEHWIGAAMSFVIFASLATLCAILLPIIVPETKGRPMGERGDKFTPKQNCMEFLQPIKTLILNCK